MAEIGFDMTRFPSAGHLVSWVGLCPRLDESAGKRLSTRVRRSNPLAEDDAGASRLGRRSQKGRVLASAIPPHQESPRPQESHPRGRRVNAHRAYHMLKYNADYRDLGADHFDRRDKTRLAKRLIARLHDLGFKVELQAA